MAVTFKMPELDAEDREALAAWGIIWGMRAIIIFGGLMLAGLSAGIGVALFRLVSGL